LSIIVKLSFTNIDVAIVRKRHRCSKVRNATHCFRTKGILWQRKSSFKRPSPLLTMATKGAGH